MFYTRLCTHFFTITPLANLHQFLICALSFSVYLRFAGCALLRGGADKSLARPGRKQATATKLGIYSTYSPRSSIHFLTRYSNFCKPLKKNLEGCPSNQVSAAVMTSTPDENWRPFNFFFQCREQVVFRRGQIRRIG